jgi:hypothetical protein
MTLNKEWWGTQFTLFFSFFSLYHKGSSELSCLSSTQKKEKKFSQIWISWMVYPIISKDFFFSLFTTEWQIRTVTCQFFHQNSRRNHRRIFCRGNHRKTLIYVISADPLLPYFFFFFLIPTLPICKQPDPPPPKTKISLIPVQQVIFLKLLWSQHPCSDLPTDFINFYK